MMRPQVEEKIKGIICEQLNVKADQALPSARFVEDLGADSLDSVEISMMVEDAFAITIEQEEIEAALTFENLVDLACSKLQTK